MTNILILRDIFLKKSRRFPDFRKMATRTLSNSKGFCRTTVEVGEMRETNTINISERDEKIS